MILKEQHHDRDCLSICTHLDQWMNERQCVRTHRHTQTHTHTHTLKHYMQGHSTDWHQGVQQYSMGCILSCSYVSMNGSVCVSWPSSLELKVRLTLVNVPMNGFVSQDWCCVRTEGEKWSSEVCVCVCVCGATLQTGGAAVDPGPSWKQTKTLKVRSNLRLNGSSTGLVSRDLFTSWNM